MPVDDLTHYMEATARYRRALRQILDVYEDSDLTNAEAQDQVAAIAIDALASPSKDAK